MIRVVNKRHFKGNGIYIGRPSLLGNPFVLGKDGNREEVIAEYKDYLKRAIEENEKVRAEFETIKELSTKGDVFIVCWCAPKKCHGDVIKQMIEDNK